MAKYVVRPELINALITAESNWNPNAVSPKGARGLAQIMPETAKNPGFGVMPLQDDSSNEQFRFVSDYLGAMLNQFDGDETMAVAAYNAGPGNVKKYGGIPPFKETQNYVARINRLLNPIGEAQAEESPQVTAESPMQYSSDNAPVKDAKYYWNKYHQEEKKDEVTKDAKYYWNKYHQESAAQQPTQREINPVSAFLSGVGGETLNAVGGLSEALGADQFSQNILNAANEGKANAPGLAGGAGKLFGAVAPFAVMPQFHALNPANTASTISLLSRFINPRTSEIITNTASKLTPYLLNAYGDAKLSGLLTPGSEEVRNKAENASLIGSALSPVISRIFGKSAGGFTKSKEGAELVREGIIPTLGEAIDQSTILGKTIRQLEESSSSFPLVGAAMKISRERAGNEWLQSIFKGREIPELGLTAGGKVGSDGIDALKESFDIAYGRQLANVHVPIDKSLLDGLGAIISNKYNGINDELRGILKNKTEYVLNAINNGTGLALANDFKRIASELFEEAIEYRRGGPIERNAGNVFYDLALYLNKHRNKFLSPEQVANVKKIDVKYGDFLALKKAAASIGAAANYGQMNGSQLLRAVQELDKSKMKDVFSRGAARLQHEAIAAKRVLGNTLSESGTTPRAITAGMLTGGWLMPETIAPMLTAVGLGVLGSTRPVQKYLIGGYKFQPGLVDFINKNVTPNIGKYGAGLGYYGANN